METFDTLTADAPPIVLRDYQCSIVDGVHRLVNAGNRRVLVVSPTGSGKRYLQCWWAKKAQDRGKRIMFVTNRRWLVKQFWDELDRFGIQYSIVMGSETTADKGESVTVCSLATLRRRYFFDAYGTPSGDGLPPADLILVDEAHLDLETYAALFKFYPHAIVLAFTATPVGPEGKALEIYSAMHVGATKPGLISRGMLVPTTMYAPSEPGMEGVKITKHEFAQGETIKRVRMCTTFANVFEAWAPFSDLPTVCFIPGVEFAEWMAQEFNRHGHRAALVEAKTPMDQRERIFEAVACGEIRVLVSVDVLRVGFDLPCLACGIDLQPTMQLRDFVQKTGRVCRAYEGKSEAIWLDFSGAYWRHGHPDEDFPWDELDGSETTADLMAKRRKKQGEPTPIVCVRCKFIRKGGDTCPKCGSKAAKIVRLIRMGDGKIKQMAPPREKKPKIPAAHGSCEWQQKNWLAALARAGQSGKTVAQARHLYKDKAGEWPPDGLSQMPERGHLDWNRKASEVYPWTNRRGK